MNSLKEAVYYSEMSKIAGIKLPKDSMEWNEEILKKFYEEQSNISSDVKSDVVINNIDDKTGYAKGSVVLWTDKGKIDFPVIINDFELKPFDTFVSDGVYFPATENNIHKELFGEEVGKVVGHVGTEANSIKTPGDTYPKSYKTVNENCGTMGCGSTSADSVYMGKMAFDWKSTINNSDFEKFAEELEVGSTISHQLFKNNPDLMTSIIDEGTHTRVVDSSSEESKVDTSNIVNRMQADVVTDAEMFDTSMLKPVIAPAEVTLRIGAKTMEDIMSSGDNMKQRFEVSSSGVPIDGYVFKLENTMQLFISKCGKYYSENCEFFAMSQKPLTDEVYSLDGRVTDFGFNGNPTDGFDKRFDKGRDNSQVYGMGSNSNYGEINGSYYIIFGSGENWKAIKKYGPFTKKIINGREAYVGKHSAIVKTNIGFPTKVEETKDPVYRAAIGKKDILMIPELAILANNAFMSNISSRLLSNTDSIKLAFDSSTIKSVDISVGGEGIIVSGKPAEGIIKEAGLTNSQLNVSDTKSVLYAMGMSKEASEKAISSMIKSASNRVSIYGVTEPYISDVRSRFMDKIASIKPILKEYADNIKVNLIKEASSIVDDPESVDRMLSLGFINEDNVLDYANFSEELKETSNKLSKILISSRLGLKDVDENSIKKAIDGIVKVTEGLDKLKLVVGDSK